jgi:hypothetical protein
MKKQFTMFASFLILSFFCTDILAQSFYTGAIGMTQSNGGRNRIFSDNLTTRAIDRTSILVGVSATAVFDYDQDQNPLVNAATVASPALSDFEVTSTIDNAYNTPPLPPNVEVKMNYYGWTNGAYILAKINVKNREAAAMNAVIGFETIPQVDGVYGGETLQWNATEKALLVNKTGWVGYKFFSAPQTSLKTMTWASGYASDANFWQWLTQNSFDAPLTVGVDGSVAILGQAPVNIAPGESVDLWYGIALGSSQEACLNNLSACQTKYATIVPVELTSFAASVTGSSVVLNWSTATEVNNYGFEIERSSDNQSWVTIGYKEGKGTTSEVQNYLYSDDISGISSEKLYYRLKQIDFNGTATYYDAVEVVNNFAPDVFVMDQNYPNPFNPSTRISFGIPEKSSVSLRIFNSIGEEVALLANGVYEAGTYTFSFDASKLPSGNYIYTLQAGSNVISRKMTLIK